MKELERTAFEGKDKDTDKWQVISIQRFCPIRYSSELLFIHFKFYSMFDVGKSYQEKSVKMNVTTIKKRDYGVTINLTRMSKEEYEFYKNSNGIIVKNFDIKISGGEMAIGGEKQRPKNGTFNITLNKQKSGKIGIHFNRPPQDKMTSSKFNRNTKNDGTKNDEKDAEVLISDDPVAATNA